MDAVDMILTSSPTGSIGTGTFYFYYCLDNDFSAGKQLAPRKHHGYWQHGRQKEREQKKEVHAS